MERIQMGLQLASAVSQEVWILLDSELVATDLGWKDLDLCFRYVNQDIFCSHFE